MRERRHTGQGASESCVVECRGRYINCGCVDAFLAFFLAFLFYFRGGSLNVVTSSLLQLDQSPSPSLGVVDIFGDSSETNGIGDQLHLVLHTSSEFI